jgi:hypothetical protein
MSTMTTTSETPAYVTDRFVAPRKCRRCAGRGYVSSRVVFAGQPGGCYGCESIGWVESDKATIAAAKAAVEMHTAIRRETRKALEAAGVPTYKACDVVTAIDHLQANSPERYSRALASFDAGHAGLTRALWAYAAENGFVLYGATPVSVEAALAMMS